MASNPNIWSRVSTPGGHFTVPAATAERAGSDWTVLKGDALDAQGRPLAPKPRTEKAPKLRAKKAAATPTPDPEIVSGDDTKE